MTRKKKPTAALVRSSAAEYLTFVASSGTCGVKAVYADENVWLSQKMMAQLYDVEVPTINYHLKNVFEDSELEENSVIRTFRMTAADGKTYDTKHYNLSAIISVGYKVNSERAVQFRKWATRVALEFTMSAARCSSGSSRMIHRPVWIVVPSTRTVSVVDAAGVTDHGYGTELPEPRGVPALKVRVDDRFEQLDGR